MSQQSNSIISGDSAEKKYKKALKQISKLMEANRMLRESNEKSTRDLKEKIDQLSLRYEDLEKQYQSVKKQKDSFAHYLDEIQKQRNNLDREVGYLNDVLAQQNAELKKLNMHKDERAVAALIRTYEEKEKTMNQNRSQNQDMIAKLKISVERLENDLQFERASKEQLEQYNKKLSYEMGSYKQQNNSLLNQIQRLLKQSSQKDAYCAQKQKQLRLLTSELQKQISLLKNSQEQSFKTYKSNDNEAYEQILSEKNRQAVELAKMQSAYEQMLMREKQYYEMEEKMKTARLQVQRANQQVNMLKSKIIVLEAKQFLQQAGDDENNQKYFEQRLNILVHENDPLNYIRNHEDSSHFRILKSFIVDLQDKIYRISSEKKQISRKYKSMKTKFVKNAQQLTHYEQQSKLMRGKLEGYERLTQKLQFELERALAGNQQEMTRMALTSNNLITRKVEEYKTAINLLNSQLEMNQDKASRTEKNYKQQIETLRLQLDTLKIRYKDETDKTNKDNELIDLYKKKNNQLLNKVSGLQDQLTNTNENLNKFEQLFKEEKGKNEGLLAQKQQLLSQTRQLSEEIDKKSLTFNSSFKMKEDQYEFQVRKLKTENQKMKDELEENARELKNLQRDLQEIRRSDQSQVGEIKRLSQRNMELEGKILEFKRTIRNLEDQIETNKIKNKKFQQNYQKNVKFEEQNINKNDKINDLTREKILLENEIKSLQNQLNDEAKQNQQYKKQLSSLKMKNLESNHENKRQFEGKILEGKKTIQSLNQDISDLTTQLRDEKSKNMRLNNQINSVKAEKNRLQDLIDQNRKKDLQNEGQVSNVKLELYNAEMEIQRLQGDIKNQQATANGLNNEIENLQQKIFSQNQELSSLKMKLQSAEDLKNDLVRDLNSIKFNFSTVETHANQAKSNINLPWQEQNYYSSLSDILLKIKKISRNYGVNIQSSNSAAGTISFSQIQLPPKTTNSQNQERPSGNGYLQFFKSYADNNETGGVSYKGASNAEANRSSNLNIATTQSIGVNRIDYNYSESLYSGGQSSGVSKDVYKPSFDFGPSISGFDYLRGNSSKVGEV